MPNALMGVIAFLLSVGTLALWIRGIRRVSLPANRTPFVAAWSAAAGLAIAALVGGPGWIGGVLATLGLVLGLFLLFTITISAQKVTPEAIRVGMTIPHFTALDEHGATFDSGALAGNPVLLKFFRGHW
jgi:Peroxiredoxin